MQEKNVKIVVFGCRLNSFEIEKMKILAESVVTKPTILINTCAVTHNAVKQAKQKVRNLSKQYPDYDIIVAGCAATAVPNDFANLPNVIKVIGNKEKFDINAYKSDKKIEVKSIELTEKLPLSLGNSSIVNNFEKLTKGFVQIQQGCNNCCSFCLVRKIRGANVSFPYEHIKKQTEMLVQNGYKEIVLTGVDIAGFCFDDTKKSNTVPDVVELIKKLLNDVPNIKRIMLSSLDPAKNWESLIDLINTDSRVMPHIHLSMQSCCDKILKLMGRRHNVKQVENLINYTNQSKKCITFGFDIICGFPNETEDDFIETYNFIDKYKITHLHVFPYSRRPGTVANNMKNQNPICISKKRTNCLIDLGNKNMTDYMNNMVGQTVRVLIEKNNVGYTDDYILAKAHNHLQKGSIIESKVISVSDGYLIVN